MAEQTLEELKAQRDELIALKQQREALVAERDRNKSSFEMPFKGNALQSANELLKITHPISTAASSIEKNAGAGMAKGLSDVGNNLANAVSWFMRQSEDKPVREFGERIKETSPRPDIYKMAGVEDEPWYTPSGAVQAVGEMIPSGELGGGISRVIGAGEKALPLINKAIHSPAINKA